MFRQSLISQKTDGTKSYHKASFLFPLISPTDNNLSSVFTIPFAEIKGIDQGCDALKILIWVSEGKKSKSWKWPAPFFQEGLAQLIILLTLGQNYFYMMKEPCLSSITTRKHGLVTVAIRCPILFFDFCTKKPPSFSV